MWSLVGNDQLTVDVGENVLVGGGSTRANVKGSRGAGVGRVGGHGEVRGEAGGFVVSILPARGCVGQRGHGVSDVDAEIVSGHGQGSLGDRHELGDWRSSKHVVGPGSVTGQDDGSRFLYAGRVAGANRHEVPVAVPIES